MSFLIELTTELNKVLFFCFFSDLKKKFLFKFFIIIKINLKFWLSVAENILKLALFNLKIAHPIQIMDN